jgi:hypothetical protein
MAAPTFSALYSIAVRKADGGIIFRPKTHNIQSERVKTQNRLFADKMTGKNIAGDCRGRKFKAFRGCLRSKGAAAYRGN